MSFGALLQPQHVQVMVGMGRDELVEILEGVGGVTQVPGTEPDGESGGITSGGRGG